MKYSTMMKKIWIIFFWLFVWQCLSCYVHNKILLVGPVETMQAMIKNTWKVHFWKRIFLSMGRIATGFFAGLFLGCLFAVWSAKSKLCQQILDPVIQLMKAIPVASFVVLFLIWWKAAFLSTMISFMVVFPTIYLNTLTGIQATDHKLLEMADVFGIKGLSRILYIYRPALSPYIASALKISVGMSWKSGVAAEVIGTPDFSIGEALYMAKIYLETADVLAWTLWVIILSGICEKLLVYLWNRFCDIEPNCPMQEPMPQTGTIKEPAVVLAHVSKSFGAESVIKDLSKVYQFDQDYYMEGASGSGKTTLFRLIAGLEAPDQGSVTIRHRIGYCFQEDRLLEEYSAVRNVMLVTNDQAYARSLLLEVLPQDALDKPCKALSGGMKRRVALVRAIACAAPILILDEPFNGLDEENLQKVRGFIDRHKKGKCVFLASHMEKGLSFL